MNTQICVACLDDLPIERFDYYVVRNYEQYNECQACREQRLIEDRIRREQYKKDNFELYVYREYIQSAKKRDIEFDLTQDELNNLIFLPCFYCGDFPGDGPTDRVGIDRVDSTIGYIKENVVPCCWMCNRSKSTLTQDEFFALCRKIVVKHNLLGR